ncbi:MAG: trigger factor [Eubacteriales bacterium]|nr:trigger factor [Eubacteriales bacterium]
MKKKAFLAVLAMCMILTATACGNDNNKEDDTKQQTEAGQDAEADAADEKEEPTSFGERLVSVDDVSKYITIGEYKGLDLDKVVEEVTEAQIESQISTELQNNREEVTDKDGAVQDGDLVTINFVGTKDGETFDGGTANNYDLTIGEGGMIDGFEDGIIGMKKGETKELPLTFPEEYPAEDLAGEDVVFKITLQNFRRAPELTDEWVAENTDVSTVDEYREKVRAQLQEDAVETAEDTMKYNAWNLVLTNSEIIEYPEEDIQNGIAEYKSLCSNYAAQADMELEDFVEAQNMTMDDFEDACRQYAESKVKQNLIIQGIMDAEGMSLSDEESLKIQDQLIADYNAADLAEMVDRYGQALVDESIGLLRVENFIAENANITEKVSNGDVIAESGDAGDSMNGTEAEAEEEIEEETEDTEEAADTEETEASEEENTEEN